MLRDGIKSIARQGGLPGAALAVGHHRPIRAEASGGVFHERRSTHQAVSYQRLRQNITQMKGCLAFGISIRVRVHRLRKLRTS